MTKPISKEDGRLLLKIARESIRRAFDTKGKTLEILKPDPSAAILEENRGVFVTLHKKGNLRGCIGNIEPDKTVFEGIKDNAKHAAFNDTRFNPLSFDELKDTIIEVSVLTRPQEIAYTDATDLMTKLRPDVDGVIIKKRSQSATFLPQVWKQLKDPKSFLSHLCIKAGLSENAWTSGDLRVFTYQVQLFEEQAESLI